MTLNREITIGNLVSWALILIGFVAGYTRLQSDVSVAKATALEAKTSAIAAQIQIYNLHTDIEVIKATTKNTETNIQEMRKALTLSKVFN